MTGYRAISPVAPPIEFTATEFMVFSLLLAAHGRVLTRIFIAERTNARDRAFDIRTIDTIVSRVRKKLRTGGASETFDLRAVRSEGYVCRLHSRARTLGGRTKPF
jgi:DNA-binding response OmpR family regulator